MKSRILVIDDNVNLTALLSKTLGRFDLEVYTENDSSFAIDTIRRVRPQVIILDVMMPHRNGGQVLAELRKDMQLHHIPVLLLSGMAREAQTLANQGGVQAVLSKPIELKVLLAEIKKQLANSRTAFDEFEERLSSQPANQPPPSFLPPASQQPEQAIPDRNNRVDSPIKFPSRNAPSMRDQQQAARPSAFGAPPSQVNSDAVKPKMFSGLFSNVSDQDDSDEVDLPR